MGPKIGLKLYEKTTANVKGCVIASRCGTLVGIYWDCFREVTSKLGKGVVDFAQSIFEARIADTVVR